MMKCVHLAVKCDPSWNGGRQQVGLEEALGRRSGVCKEKAASLSMVYRLSGAEAEFVRGTLEGERHAWLKVNAKGKEWLADPTNNWFGYYDSVSKKRGFVEGENLIIKSDRQQ